MCPTPFCELMARSEYSRSRFRYDELLAYLYLVWVFELVAIGFENPHVLVRIAVELFADLRETISRPYSVGLRSAFDSAG